MSSRIATPKEQALAQPLQLVSLDAEHQPAQTDTAAVAVVSQSELSNALVRIQQLEEACSELERECARRAQESHELGRTEGFELGRAQGAQEVKGSIDRMSAAIAETAVLRRRLRRDAELDLVKLSLAIARRILGREVSIDPEALHGVVKAALERLGSAELLAVKTHPAHLSSVRDQLARRGVSAHVQVEGDANLEEGALRIETSRGGFDASINSQLMEIERGFAARLRA